MAKPAADKAVTVRLPAYQWYVLLGYLSALGIGDELEAFGWINAQLSHQMADDGSDDDGV